MNYTITDEMISYEDEKRNTVVLTNFSCRIEEEHRYVDGKTADRFYVIAGRRKVPGGEPEDLQPVTIRAEEFAGMAWIQNAWGSQVIIMPKPSAKEMLRTIIQLDSQPIVKTIYTHTGWAVVDGVDTYLTCGSCLDAKRRRDDIEIMLPPDLKVYNLPRDQGEPQAAFHATIDLARKLPPSVGWMLVSAAFRAPIGPSDFGVHVTGRTGTFKSEIASLIQSHFGETDARNLPAAWSSTGNALEALAYRAKNAIFVIDDFIPMGTSWQQKTYQKTADQIIRAQGNQAGRARLTDTSSLQQTMYPRGLLFSTGEDTPEGHSVRGRLMIAELDPGEFAASDLSEAQKNRKLYPYGMADYIQWLAGNLKVQRQEARTMAESVRDENLRIGHSRTPSALGNLAAGAYTMVKWAVERGWIGTEEANRLYSEAVEQLKKTASRQVEYLTAADPAEQFISVLRGIFAASAGHLKAMNGGIPRHAAVLGWTAIGDGVDAEHKPHGPRIGWACDQTKIAYLDAAVAYDTVRRHSRGAITITKQTLYKRLKENNLLAKVDTTRQRNTVRVQCENAGRVCLALPMQSLTEGDKE